MGTGSQPGRPSGGAVATLRKLGLAIAIFVAITGGWAFAQYRVRERAAAMPLPDAGGRQGACALWFVGSSSIFRWRTLAQDMRPWNAHNRGINGVLLDEIDRHFEARDAEAPPRAIILYAGENDIAAGRPVARVLADLDRFLEIKTRRFGALPVVMLSLKPSPTRWANRPQQIAFNAAIERLAAARADLTYVDTVSKLLVDGRPGPYYVADGVHMNAAGYRRWTGPIRDALAQALPPAILRACTAPAGMSRDGAR